MTFKQIREIGVQRGVRVVGITKSEIVRSIQRQEGNWACFDTGKAQECGQSACLWMAACR